MAGDSEFNAAPPAKRQKRAPPMVCCVCRDPVDSEDVPYRCNQCRYGIFCTICLTEWFLKALVDETRMPVKCCDGLIPPACLGDTLSDEEVKRYEAKHEEWSTFDKLYCPIPRCSAFIPAGLYLEDPAQNKLRPLTADTSKNQTVQCPECNIEMCTTCRGIAHPIEGDQCTSPRADFDPVLEAQFKKWGVKRCPRCKAPVRLMYGCSSVQCRCSHHFCFRCLEPIDECDGRCEDDNDAESDENDDNDDGENDDQDDDDDETGVIISDMVAAIGGDTPRADTPHPRDDDDEVETSRSDPPNSERRTADQPYRRHEDLVATIGRHPILAERAARMRAENTFNRLSNRRETTLQRSIQNSEAASIIPVPGLAPNPGPQEEGPDEPDLDARLEGPELDLGSDPDEAPQWKCRHSSWMRIYGKRSHEIGTCAWCKKRLVSADHASNWADLTAKQQDAAMTDHTYWTCAQCAIQACFECAELLEVRESASSRRGY
ncbi:hypothetical protein NKR23_g1394 [Pleurostoma richardsiae]|uniref:RBR-type E3 ubiquitin transferase n=1 Tax=Pleurostoma richardsiae TaxID=41990 RepID=A0AA38VK36_9PEZI|nr:hypothetical protein NKR23_g1394 [Pleurostoma richardsiae]